MKSRMGSKFGRILKKSERTAAVRAAQIKPPRSIKMKIRIGRAETRRTEAEEVLSEVQIKAVRVFITYYASTTTIAKFSS